MTGTSLDGLDAALVRVEGTGLAIQAQCAAYCEQGLGELASTLRALANGEAQAAAAFLEAARSLGEIHAQAAAQLVEALPRSTSLDAIAAHGQSICHWPAAGRSWQLFDPWPIVHRLGVPVVFDLRQADLVAGGEGAPITPLADWVFFRSDQRHRVVINLGGIGSITALPAGAAPQSIAGADVTPCNLLLDGLAQRLGAGLYDADGQQAQQGQTHPTIIDTMHQRIDQALAQHRTLGREQFQSPWFDRLIEQLQPDANEARDILACACEVVAQRLTDHPLVREAEQLVLAGGGAKNAALVAALKRSTGSEIITTDQTEAALPIQARECAAMAVLGALCWDGIPITLPQVTGARTPGVAGTWAGWFAPHARGPKTENFTQAACSDLPDS
jgi:1,6-anhydro-N-acetylmuramate kinase